MKNNFRNFKKKHKPLPSCNERKQESKKNMQICMNQLYKLTNIFHVVNKL